VGTTTSLSYVLPPDYLVAGHTVSWTITACNGTTCDALPALSSWWGLTAAATDPSTTAPGPVSLTSPADDAPNQGSTPAPSWTAPSGAITAVTQYTLVLRDGPAGTGNTIATLPETTSTTLPVPAQALLGANHVYSWNVQGCTGLVCGPFGDTWRTFYTGPAPTGTPGIVQQLSPADTATATGTSPALSWSQPSGAVSGSTTYTVAIWDPTTNSVLTTIAAGTVLSIPVPASAGLVQGRSYHWNVTACNGTACSAYADHWFAFSTAAAPSVVTMTSPADGSGGWSPTPQLSWSFSGGISGVTTCTVSFWDPYGAPQGHAMPDLQGAGETCGASSGLLQVPVTQQLFYGQSYEWNVQVCNGEACSGFAPHWFSFTIGAQPPVGASGAGLTTVPNGDFAAGAAGWTGNYSSIGYLNATGVTTLTSTAFTLDNSGGNWFRLASNVTSGGSLIVKFGPANSQTQVASYTGTGAWVESTFQVPPSAGSTGQLTLTCSVCSIGYIERLDGPAAHGGPGLGLNGDPRFPKNVGAVVGGGVDVTTGAFDYAQTDLALPGVLGISFARGYSNQANTAAVIPGGGPSATGPLGPKWTHTWQYSFVFLNSTTLSIRVPGGGSYVFFQTGGLTTWLPTAGTDATLTSSGSTYTLTTTSQIVYSFALISGAERLASVTDRNGNTISLTYDGSGNLTRITDPGGRYISLSYSLGRISSASDSAGRSVSYGYDANTGDLTSVTDVRSGVTRYAYLGHWLSQIADPLNNVVLRNTYDSAQSGQQTTNGLGQVTTQTDAAGGTLGYAYGSPSAGVTTLTDQRGKHRTFYWDGGLRVTDIVDAYGNRLSGSYDADNNLMGVSNNLGGVQAHTFDNRGNVLSITDAWNYTSYFAYDGLNDLLTSTDPLNNATTRSYDAKGNLVKVVDALGDTTTQMVNSLGQVTAVTDPRNTTTSFGYSAAGDRTTVTDALSHTTTSAYDGAGRPTSATDPLNHTASTTYDAAGNVLTVTDALNHTTTSTYDADGQHRSIQDANLKTTTYNYDARGLLTSVIDPQNGSGAPTSYAYDLAGNRITVTDAKGQATHYTFDDDERPATVTDPLGKVLHTYTYDTSGRLATDKDAKNQTTTYAYTLRNQLSGMTYADGSTVAYQYDSAGNRTQMVDGTGTTTYSYDALNRPTSVAFPGSKTVAYGYDAAGNRSSITYPGGTHQVTYGYDQLNRLSSVTDWNSQQTSYTYDAAGRLTGTTLPASTGVTSAYSYDNANELLSVMHSKGGSTIASASYTLDAVGNRTQKTTPAGTETYSYDNLYRLTQATAPSSGTTGYSYDQVGNRLTMTTSAGTTNYAYDAGDQLTSVTPAGSGAQSNSYDANGSETARGADTLNWSAANLLTSATMGGQSFSASYNGDQLRTSRTVAGTTTNFVWDVASGTPVVLDDGTQYVYGAGLVAQVTSSGTFYFLADGLGSTMAIVDGTGTVVESYGYDAFGQTTSSSGSHASEYRFAGQQTDPSGLQYLRARYYDSSTGRLMNRDPSQGCIFNPASNHPYTYAGNNPATKVDPSGLQAERATADDIHHASMSSRAHGRRRRPDDMSPDGGGDPFDDGPIELDPGLILVVGDGVANSGRQSGEDLPLFAGPCNPEDQLIFPFVLSENTATGAIGVYSVEGQTKVAISNIPCVDSFPGAEPGDVVVATPGTTLGQPGVIIKVAEGGKCTFHLAFNDDFRPDVTVQGAFIFPPPGGGLEPDPEDGPTCVPSSVP
jgi:RHS repeat-associated protein